jgi:pyruvate dehydrogenase E1 component beta subunit
MAQTSYREALRAAHREALQRDARVFVMGEDVGRYGGSYAVTKGLLDEFGEARIRDTPLSELGFVGAGIGAALGGMRPIVEVMTVNFSLLALDPIVNTAAALRHMSGGQFSVPVVIRMATGAGRQLAAQHSHSLEVWYAHVPGIKVLAPATLEDARGMLWPALQDPDPVVMFEHAQLYNLEGDLADPPPAVDIEHAAVRRAGTALTLVTYGGSLPRVLAAAETLAQDGVDVEVVDLRVLRPLDTATRCARRTGCWSSTKAGAPAAWPPRSWRGSARTPSTTSTRRWRACAAKRCRCLTPSTWKTLRCRCRRRSSRRPRRCWQADD